MKEKKLWTEKYYKIKGEDIDNIRCIVATLIEELGNQNFGYAISFAFKLNNIISNILSGLKEIEEDTK